MAVGHGVQFAHHVEHVLAHEPGHQRQFGVAGAGAALAGAHVGDSGAAARRALPVQPIGQRVLGNGAVQLDGGVDIPSRVFLGS